MVHIAALASALAAMDSNQVVPPEPRPVLRGLVGGAVYGLTVAAVSQPFDTIKARLQVGDHPLKGGPLALYNGVGVATAASVMFRAVSFVGYEGVSSALRTNHVLDAVPPMQAFIAGAVGGVMRGFLETPAELIKTRQQLQTTWKFAALFDGLYSTCLRNAAIIGVYWVLIEASEKWRSHLPVMLNYFAAGGICAVGSWALCFPLDAAKTQIQSGRGEKMGVAGHIRSIYKENGVGGLYRGMGAGLMRVFVGNGLGMITYRLVQDAFAAQEQRSKLARRPTGTSR